MTLWRRQIFAILRIDLRKTFFSRRGIWIWHIRPNFIGAFPPLRKKC